VSFSTDFELDDTPLIDQQVNAEAILEHDAIVLP